MKRKASGRIPAEDRDTLRPENHFRTLYGA